jgi:homoserine O-acetyltransferase/O-succinyltransferase
MDSHDVGRGRGGVEAALGAVGGRLIGVGIPGDVLYSEEEVLRWTRLAGAEYREIRSIRGHDAFLIEADQVSALLRGVLVEDNSGRTGPVEAALPCCSAAGGAR